MIPFEFAADSSKVGGAGVRLVVAKADAVTDYEQIAAFPADYIVKLDDYLAFDGRIERDGWVSQAAELAQGRPAKSAELPDLPDEQPENATQQD